MLTYAACRGKRSVEASLNERVTISIAACFHLSVCVCVCHSSFYSLSLSLSLSHSHTHTRTHKHTNTHTHASDTIEVGEMISPLQSLSPLLYLFVSICLWNFSPSWREGFGEDGWMHRSEERERTRETEKREREKRERGSDRQLRRPLTY